MRNPPTAWERVSRRAAIRAALKTGAYVAPAVVSMAYARGVAAVTPPPTSVAIQGVCTVAPSHFFYNVAVSGFAISGAPPNAQLSVHIDVYYVLGDSASGDMPPVTVDANGTAVYSGGVILIPPSLAPGPILQVTLRASQQGTQYALAVIPGAMVAFTGAMDCLIIPHQPVVTFLGTVPSGQLAGYRFRGTGFPVDTNPGGAPNLTYDVTNAAMNVVYGPSASLSGPTFFVSVPFLNPGPVNYTFRTFLTATNAFITSVTFTA